MFLSARTQIRLPQVINFSNKSDYALLSFIDIALVLRVLQVGQLFELPSPSDRILLF